MRLFLSVALWKGWSIGVEQGFAKPSFCVCHEYIDKSQESQGFLDCHIPRRLKLFWVWLKPVEDILK